MRIIASAIAIITLAAALAYAMPSSLPRVQEVIDTPGYKAWIAERNAL